MPDFMMEWWFLILMLCLLCCLALVPVVLLVFVLVVLPRYRRGRDERGAGEAWPGPE